MADEELQTTFADNIASKFKELLVPTEDIELRVVCLEQQSLRPLLTVADVSVSEERRAARKNPLVEPGFKEASRVKRVAFITLGLQKSHQLNFVRSTLKLF